MLAGKRDGHPGLCECGTVQATMWECQAGGQRADQARETDRQTAEDWFLMAAAAQETK